MRYVFYGRNLRINYYIRTVTTMGHTVAMLDESRGYVSSQKFFSKDIPIKLEVGEYIEINGESIEIVHLKYNVEKELFECHTDKILSVVDGNMTKEQAKEKLEEAQKELDNNDGFGFFKRLFGRG